MSEGRGAAARRVGAVLAAGGPAAQRNHAGALAELVRACELWAELGQLPPSIAAVLARVHAVGGEEGP